jgi:hypothetical protein
MTTKLTGPLKRELEVDGRPYTLTITADGLRLVPKGHRNGYELAWKSLLSGEAALAAALGASVQAGVPEPQGPVKNGLRGGKNRPDSER